MYLLTYFLITIWLKSGRYEFLGAITHIKDLLFQSVFRSFHCPVHLYWGMFMACFPNKLLTFRWKHKEGTEQQFETPTNRMENWNCILWDLGFWKGCKDTCKNLLPTFWVFPMRIWNFQLIFFGLMFTKKLVKYKCFQKLEII